MAKVADENVRVFVRVRPPLPRELGAGDAVHVHGTELVYVETEEVNFQCKFHHVFPPSASQADVYERVRDCVDAALDGFNSTLFAYGQTGSGKSYTLFGQENDPTVFGAGHGPLPASAGIIPRAIRDVFAGVRAAPAGRSITLHCSFMQIYNENLFDLLRDPARQVPLAVHEDSASGIFVEGLSEFAVRNQQDCFELLQRGDENRAIRQTYMNEHSSRSHAIFQLTVEQRDADTDTVTRSKLNLVDLAGSEKWNMGVDMDDPHIAEMTNINLSLHTLGKCIAALARRKQHVPFRESKLTRLLQDSLGGNTKTRMIATLSPSALCVHESVSTLKFADCARQVMMAVRVNAVRSVDPAYVRKLERELAHLRAIVSGMGGVNHAALAQYRHSPTSGGTARREDGENSDVGAHGGTGAMAGMEPAALMQLTQENARLRRQLLQLQSALGEAAQAVSSGGGQSDATVTLALPVVGDGGNSQPPASPQRAGDTLGTAPLLSPIATNPRHSSALLPSSSPTGPSGAPLAPPAAVAPGVAVLEELMRLRDMERQMKHAMSDVMRVAQRFFDLDIEEDQLQRQLRAIFAKAQAAAGAGPAGDAGEGGARAAAPPPAASPARGRRSASPELSTRADSKLYLSASRRTQFLSALSAAHVGAPGAAGADSRRGGARSMRGRGGASSSASGASSDGGTERSAVPRSPLQGVLVRNSGIPGTRSPPRRAIAAASPVGGVALSSGPAAFRVRGKDGKASEVEAAGQQSAEEVLEREMRDAQARMRKYRKLQEWQAEKQRREQARRQAEEEAEAQQLEAARLRDLKWRQRAQEQKERLLSLHTRAIAAAEREAGHSRANSMEDFDYSQSDD